MAIQIRDTPVLTGRDAIRFREQMAKNIKDTPEVKARIITNYNKIKNLIK